MQHTTPVIQQPFVVVDLQAALIGAFAELDVGHGAEDGMFAGVEAVIDDVLVAVISLLPGGGADNEAEELGLGGEGGRVDGGDVTRKRLFDEGVEGEGEFEAVVGQAVTGVGEVVGVGEEGEVAEESNVEVGVGLVWGEVEGGDEVETGMCPHLLEDGEGGIEAGGERECGGVGRECDVVLEVEHAVEVDIVGGEVEGVEGKSGVTEGKSTSIHVEQHEAECAPVILAVLTAEPFNVFAGARWFAEAGRSPDVAVEDAVEGGVVLVLDGVVDVRDAEGGDIVPDEKDLAVVLETVGEDEVAERGQLLIHAELVPDARLLFIVVAVAVGGAGGVGGDVVEVPVTRGVDMVVAGNGAGDGRGVSEEAGALEGGIVAVDVFAEQAGRTPTCAAAAGALGGVVGGVDVEGVEVDGKALRHVDGTAVVETAEAGVGRVGDVA